MRSAADAAPSFLYLPELRSQGESFTLAGDDARYLAKVVRVGDGERVTATDGAGTLAVLLVESTRPDVRLRVVSRQLEPRPAGARLLCGAPEGERGDWLVEKAAELGVTELVPVDTSRARWTAPQRLERWQRLAAAALRQSRSAWIMRVSVATPLAEVLAGLESGTRWLADPGGVDARSCAWPEGTPVTGAIGPSSGFSDDERNALQTCGFIAVALANSRLRTETAALSLAALWAARRVSDKALPPPPIA